MMRVKVCFQINRDVISVVYIFVTVGFVVMTINYFNKYHYASNQGITYNFNQLSMLHKDTSLPEMRLNKENKTSVASALKNGSDVRENNVTFISNSPEFRNYIQLRKTRVNPSDYRFIIAGESVCQTPPYLLIVILSKLFNVEERAAIRETWGNWSHDKLLSTSLTHYSVKLVFMFGNPWNSTDLSVIALRESTLYGDIVMADFTDSYYNLTKKVLMTLRWTSKFCKGAKFLLKVDEDTFVHVTNLLLYLKTLTVQEKGIIIGHAEFKHEVLRSGKWELPFEDYPLEEYPAYVSGNSYVISGNIVHRLHYVAEYLPYIYIEDVFITGIVREAIGAELRHREGFTWWTERPPRLCGFHNQVRISATNVDARLMRQLGEALHLNLTNCYDSSTLQKLEFVNLWPPK